MKIQELYSLTIQLWNEHLETLINPDEIGKAKRAIELLEKMKELNLFLSSLDCPVEVKYVPPGE